MAPDYFGSNYWGSANITGNITWYDTGNSTNGVSGYPVFTYGPTAVLPSVVEGPSQELIDRDWLDAQIDEVCALA